MCYGRLQLLARRAGRYRAWIIYPTKMGNCAEYELNRREMESGHRMRCICNALIFHTYLSMMMELVL